MTISFTKFIFFFCICCLLSQFNYAQTWQVVGNASFSAGGARWASLAIDTKDTPYEAFIEEANSVKATVLKSTKTELTITTQPVAASITGGQNAGFIVGAAGEEVITYQWQEKKGSGEFTNVTNGGIYSGVNSTTLTLTKIPISMNGYQYRAILSNGDTTTSNVASLTVNVPAFDDDRSWQTVGAPGFSMGEVEYISLALDKNGTPYISYEDWGNHGRLAVKKFNGSSWVEVGPAGITDDFVRYTSLVFDDSGTPFIGYMDGANDAKATVKKYINDRWVTVGTEGFSTGDIWDFSLQIDVSGTPYVAYVDRIDNYIVTVKKFDGSNWIVVGPEGLPIGVTYDIGLALGADGTPFITYKDTEFNKDIVLKYTNEQWKQVGTTGIAASGNTGINLVVDANNTPYIAFIDGANRNKITVKKFDGDSWVDVGAPAFSVSSVSHISLALDAVGVPFVAYCDFTFNYRSTMRRFDGSNWKVVGENWISPRGVAYNSIALDAKGNIYIAYRDGAVNSKATVMQFTSAQPIPTDPPLPTGIEESALAANLSLYPNPTNNKLKIILPLPVKTSVELRLINAKGQVLLQKNYPRMSHEFNQVISLKNITPGFYLLQFIVEDGIITKRIIIE